MGTIDRENPAWAAVAAGKTADGGPRFPTIISTELSTPSTRSHRKLARRGANCAQLAAAQAYGFNPSHWGAQSRTTDAEPRSGGVAVDAGASGGTG